MEYIRRAALVIGYNDLDVSARIASGRSEGVGFEHVLRLDFLRVAIGQKAKLHGRGLAEVWGNCENGSSSDAVIATMMWLLE